VPLGFQPNSKIADAIPVNLMFNGVPKILQDFVAPVFLFLKADYQLTIKEAGDILSSGDIEMEATVSQKMAGREIRKFQTGIKISQDNVFLLTVQLNDAKISIICRNDLD
jgi:hypothetical protein